MRKKEEKPKAEDKSKKEEKPKAEDKSKKEEKPKHDDKPKKPSVSAWARTTSYLKTIDAYQKQVLWWWIGGLLATTGLMLLILLTGERSLNFTLIIFYTVLKFLAGFGVMIGITSLGTFILTKFGDKFKGEQNRQRMTGFYAVMILLPIFLLIYNFTKIISSAINGKSMNNILSLPRFVWS